MSWDDYFKKVRKIRRKLHFYEWLKRNYMDTLLVAILGLTAEFSFMRIVNSVKSTNGTFGCFMILIVMAVIGIKAIGTKATYRLNYHISECNRKIYELKVERRYSRTDNNDMTEIK